MVPYVLRYKLEPAVINICIYRIAVVHEASVEAEKDAYVMNLHSAFRLRVSISWLSEIRGY